MKKSISLPVTLFSSLIFLLSAFQVLAQPSPQQLADQISAKNSERIAAIDNILITVSPENGGFFPETTTAYEKIYRDGRYILVAEEADMDIGMLSGAFDDQMPLLVRAAHTIISETYNGRPVYRVEVDDTDALNELGSEYDDYDYYEDEEVVISAVIWIDQRELYPLRIDMEQLTEEGFEISVSLTMEDYREYSGLAIPHRITMKIDGIEDQFTDEDLAEARGYLRELEEQLALMPADQREMIENQLRPQMEMFEAMLEGDGFGLGDMVFVVTDVQVNR
ncbi:MAG: hypothetical protein EA391_00780 [Balneolaceae bacterium]|nr:MAG: hypothetical protein EA391_00780 [Balneolaceae bacterium]